MAAARASAEQEARVAADTFRTKHGLDVHPIADIAAMVERTTGVDVAVLDAPADQHGMTVRDPVSGAVFIGVATTEHPMRQRSTIAHELAHLLFEDWTSIDDGKDLSARSHKEKRADAFARNLLIPEAGLQMFVSRAGSFTEADLSQVVQLFQVSPALASIALYGCGYISDDAKKSWMKSPTTPALATRYGWLDQYAGLQAESRRPRAPQRLMTRAVRGFEEGVVTPAMIASAQGTTAESVAQRLAAAGVERRPVVPTAATTSDLPDVALEDLHLEDLDDTEQV